MFGLAITTKVYSYELRGIQKCNAVVDSVKRLEAELEGAAGAFRDRPDGLGVSGRPARL